MNFVFISNYFNHHQKPFCDAMYRLTNGSFLFIATSVMREERRAMGYQMENIPGYVKCSYEGNASMQECMEAINGADVVIAGGIPQEMLKERIKKKKFILRYQERPFKEEKNFPYLLALSIVWHIRNPRKKPIYMLCAGAYTASDYGRMGLFKGKTFRWGYFPETKTYDTDALFAKKDPRRILWCGRFLDWKQPEVAVAVAERLHADGYDFKMEMIGAGDRLEAVKMLVEEKCLGECVDLKGNMTPAQVRQAMESAGIYLVTSNRKEGWGAVLNESMNSGCAVVACRDIGAVPFLVENEKNGYIYADGDIDAIYTRVKGLLDKPERQKELGIAAYKTVLNLWNAECAAQRLMELSDALLHGREFDDYSEGPCSPTHLSAEFLPKK